MQMMLHHKVPHIKTVLWVTWQHHDKQLCLYISTPLQPMLHRRNYVTALSIPSSVHPEYISFSSQ